jgi:hypothetical protein
MSGHSGRTEVLHGGDSLRRRFLSWRTLTESHSLWSRRIFFERGKNVTTNVPLSAGAFECESRSCCRGLKEDAQKRFVCQIAGLRQRLLMNGYNRFRRSTPPTALPLIVPKSFPG